MMSLLGIPRSDYLQNLWHLTWSWSQSNSVINIQLLLQSCQVSSPQEEHPLPIFGLAECTTAKMSQLQNIKWNPIWCLPHWSDPTWQDKCYLSQRSANSSVYDINSFMTIYSSTPSELSDPIIYLVQLTSNLNRMQFKREAMILSQ